MAVSHVLLLLVCIERDIDFINQSKCLMHHNILKHRNALDEMLSFSYLSDTKMLFSTI